MLLQDAIDAYLQNLEDRALSRSHLTSVRVRLSRLSDRFPDRRLDDAESRDINLFFRELKEAGLAEGTRAGHASTIKAFFNFCLRNGFLPYVPTSELPKFHYSPVHRRAAPTAAVAALVAAIPHYAAHRGYRPRDVKDALVVSFAADCGARLGEIHSLRWSDVNHALAAGRQTNSGRISYTVIGYGKTGASSLRFFSETAELFRLWKKSNPWSGSPHVFCSLHTGKLVRVASLGRAFERISKFAKIPTIRSQALRKRNVTDIIKMSGDWKRGQMFANHQNLSVTMEFYNDVLIEDLDNDAAELATMRRGGVGANALANSLFGRRA